MRAFQREAGIYPQDRKAQVTTQLRTAGCAVPAGPSRSQPAPARSSLAQPGRPEDAHSRLVSARQTPTAAAVLGRSSTRAGLRGRSETHVTRRNRITDDEPSSPGPTAS
eukprot:gene18633-25146_t